MKRTVTNCFYKDSYGGIGDFLRGSLYLYEFCKDRKMNFSLSFKHHSISNFIRTKKEFEYEEKQIIDVQKICSKTHMNQLGQSKKLYERIKKETTDVAMIPNGKLNVFMYTNYSNLFLLNQKDVIGCINHTEKLTEDCKKWFQENLIFSEEINKKAKEELSKLGLTNVGFNVIHFRIGDQSSFLDLEYSSKKVEFDSIFAMCKEKIKNSTIPTLILSDNNKLKHYIVNESKKEQLPIFCTHFESQHTQKTTSPSSETEIKTSKQGDFNATLDMKLISLSKNVDSYSNYFWGSGFVTWISKIYNIPFSSSGI